LFAEKTCLRLIAQNANYPSVSKKHAIKLIGHKFTFHVAYQFREITKMPHIIEKQTFKITNITKKETA
jgi:hypothetical protein